MDASARSADRAEMDWMSADADRNHPLMLHCVSSPDRYSSKPVMNNTQGNTTDRLLGIVRSARRTGLRLADAIRVNELVGRTAWRAQRLLILCYHGVSIDDEHKWADLYVSAGHLARRLELLRSRGATIVSLDDGLEQLARGDLPPMSVCLTFDDGAHDFSSRAMPVLSAANAHSTLYLTTYYCGRNQPVFDTVASYLLWKARGRTVRLPEVDLVVTIPDQTSSPQFADIHNELRRYALVHGFDADQKNAFARALAIVVGVDFDAILERKLFQIMSPEEVAALDPALVSVQLHTHRHRTPRDEALFKREIEDNRVVIERLRGPGPTRHFCYPSGDYVREYGEWLREDGVQFATTCDPGLASRSSDPLFLPRFVDTENVPAETFMAWVSGLSYVAFARRTTTPVRLTP